MLERRIEAVAIMALAIKAPARQVDFVYLIMCLPPGCLRP
jgi:hypothetical protein